MRFASLFSIILGIVGLITSCHQKNPTPAQKNPTLLVSIAPYQFLTERIVGDAFTVQTVVPLGANPHTYEPTFKQVHSLENGKIWFRIGEPFEEKVLAVLKDKNPDFLAIDLREGLDLLEESSHSCASCSNDHRDRHIWLSPKLAAIQTEKMASVLAEQFPEKRETFLENSKKLISELEQIDAEIASLLSSVRDRVILVSHPAFSYFCHDYNFEQLSVESEGKDVRPKHLEQILQQAVQQGAELALALPQHDNKGAQMIAEKLRVPVRMIDPYSPDYFETLLLLAHMIADPNYRE